MTQDIPDDESQEKDTPTPPRNNVEEGTYALGIWEDGQTLYEYKQNPLRDTSPKWNLVDHFEHSDPEVQRINFQSATAEPQSDDGSLEAVWVFTKELSQERAETSDTEATESSDSGSQPEEGGSSGDDRSLGEIGADTTFHRALHTVDRLSSGESDPVPVSDVNEESSDVKGTVYSAMSTLYSKKLLDRKKRDREGKQNVNVYWLSDYGKTMLEELGDPS